jgi:hypothetical protein
MVSQIRYIFPDGTRGAKSERAFMRVTSEDAAIMYARACRAWYGRSAPRIVRDKIEELRRAGDHGGVIAWLQVANQLEQLQNVNGSAPRYKGHFTGQPIKP